MIPLVLIKACLYNFARHTVNPINRALAVASTDDVWNISSKSVALDNWVQSVWTGTNTPVHKKRCIVCNASFNCIYHTRNVCITIKVHRTFAHSNKKWHYLNARTDKICQKCKYTMKLSTSTFCGCNCSWAYLSWSGRQEMSLRCNH